MADDWVHGGKLLLSALHVSLLYYFMSVGWLDLFFVSLFLGLTSADTLVSLVRRSNLTPLLQVCVSSSLVAFAVFGRVRPSPNPKDDAAEWTGPAGPYLIPSRTSHRRQFPKKHSFSYSYLVVGVPVGYSGNVNGVVSVAGGSDASHPGRPRLRAWFDVDAADYLQRGHGELGLRGKLDSYLRSQDVDPSDYPHAYLITAARFLGYHFNPVSFWYLYSPDKVLAAMVLEVNNTFGERRPYLVLRDFAAEAKQGVDASRIKGSWHKDFHVSPFNSRKGSYSLLANDPLDSGLGGFRGLDVTINLRSTKGHGKIVARLFSDGDSVDPSLMSAAQRLRFILSWSWVGFVTFPRIVKEAAVLFFKRKLHVWYRPEPLKDSLARQADDIETSLERVFRRYLQSLVEQSSASALSVRYVPSGVAYVADQVYTSAAAAARPEAAERIDVIILTPVFYSRFVRYAHDFEAVFSELVESGTVWVDKPHLLPDIFPDKASSPLPPSSLTDLAAFKLIQTLRRRPEVIPPPPVTSARAGDGGAAPPTSRPSDIRHFPTSPMDAFVLRQGDRELTATYRSAVLRLMVADRWLMGRTELLGVVETSGRAGLAWLSASLLGTALGI